MSSFFFLIWNHLNFNFQEFLIQNSLWKNCFYDNFQSICFNLHLSSKIKVHKQKHYLKKFFKLCKCFLNLLCKCKESDLLTHLVFLEQVDKWFSHTRIIANKSSIKIHKIKKYLYFLKHFKFWLICNSINLIEIHWYLIHAHNKFQKLHFYDKKLVLD